MFSKDLRSTESFKPPIELFASNSIVTTANIFVFGNKAQQSAFPEANKHLIQLL